VTQFNLLKITHFCRAFTAAARRQERPQNARIESAIQASRFHYERTGRCFYITEAVVMGDTSFEELEEYEQFWDSALLLPDNVTREQLYEEHVDSLEAAGAHFPPPAIGCVPMNVHYNPNALSSQHSSFHGSQSQNTFSQGSLDGQNTLSQKSLDGSLNVNGNTMLAYGYSIGRFPGTGSQPFIPSVMNLRTLSVDPTLASLCTTSNVTSNGREVIDLTSIDASPTSSPPEEEVDFDEWLHDQDDNEEEEAEELNGEVSIKQESQVA
jgi:hypothetical protein